MQQPSISVTHHTAFDWRARLRAAGIHLALSALVALVVGTLVFLVWYPYPYRSISSGRELFQLVISVDIVLGPLLTFAVFNRAKPRSELRRDLAVVALLQLGGLAYGLWSVDLARPVHTVFEYDRFRVVHQAEIPLESADKVPAGIELAPAGRPTLLALRPFHDAAEKADFTLAAIRGLPLSARPISALKQRFPQQAAAIDAALAASGHDATRAAYLPLLARKATAWTVLLDAQSAEVIGYLPLDSF